MSLAIDNLNDLDTELVVQLQSEFSQLVQEQYPEIETLRRGPFHDLVVYFAGGISGAMNQTVVSRLQQSMSLAAIEANPALADDAYVDAVLSNYMITRRQGTKAVGEITIVISQNITNIISAGLTFLANGVTLQVATAYTAKPYGETASGTTERVLQPLGDGTYSFTVAAVAVDVGVAGNVPRGAQLTPSVPPANYVTSYTAIDFVGGSDTETNSNLMQRLRLGIAAKVMQGRTNIEALIKEQPLFYNTLAYSIVGYGNEEMTRDQHGLVPISSGGRIDIYARTAALPQSTTLSVTATYIAQHSDGGVWQFSLPTTSAPGFYEVLQIRLPSDPADIGTFEILADIRGVDLPTDTFAPDLLTAIESAYTSYQTAVIQFVDTATNHLGLAIGDTQTYTIVITGMPYIADLQTFCNRADIRHLASDVAVKAAVPCFLTVNAEIQIAVDTSPPDTDAVKTAMADAVNALGFPGQLHVSLLHDVMHAFLASRQAVSHIMLHGRIRRPNGETHIIRDDDVLRIPDDPGNLVTGNTVAFILDPRDIGLSVVTSGYTRTA